MMSVTLESIAMLRAVVGYLGEQDQFAWWRSSFFGSSAGAFLAPVFSRTQVLAQCVGVTQAAALTHDQRIGVGQVYHLFRLPEDIEQGINRVLRGDALCLQITKATASRGDALIYLRQPQGNKPKQPTGVGPTRVGPTLDLRNTDRWPIVASYYLHGFDQASEIYPYFADKP